MEVMSVSVLIPAHNDGGVLRECLQAIAKQTHPVDQIVVVADTCTDDTAEVAASFGCEVVTANAKAKSAAQNVGLPYVTGDVLVCIDADTVIAPDVIEQFLESLTVADATCANMLPMPQQRGFWVANRRFAYALGRFWWRWCQSELGRLMVLSGCANAFRTEMVRSLGGFPGGLVTCDMDLTWSFYAAGYSVSFCYKALAYTYDPETFRVYTQQMRRWASGFFQNFASHRRQLLKPAAALVVGTLLLDLTVMPIVYALAAWVVITRGFSATTIEIYGASMAVHLLLCAAIASRTITWRQAILGWPCYWIANWWNKAIYIWTGIREWILGRHYTSWTGRQGRKTEVTPMSKERRITLSILAVIAGVLISACTGQAATRASTPSTTRCHSYPFNGPAGALRDSQWQRITWSDPGQLQRYTTSIRNASLDGHGNFVITARKNPFTSARLQTSAACTVLYGQVSVRLQWTATPGMWPAVWLETAGDQRELDVFEAVGREPDMIVGTSHVRGRPQSAHVLYAQHPLSGWHTYTLDWTPSTLTWRIDGKVYGFERTRAFHKPMFLVMDMAIGGSDWAGPPDQQTTWPGRLVIDWIRLHNDR